MNTWMAWLALAGIVVILELSTGTFYLLMISLGLVAGALTAFLSHSLELQLFVAAIVGSVATLALHRSKFGWRKNHDAARDPNVNMDIGQSLHVAHWQDLGNGIYSARTRYRGAQWDVELRHSASHAGNFIIEEIVGSRLIVRPA